MTFEELVDARWEDEPDDQIPVFPIVEILWEDAQSLGDNWITEQDVLDTPLARTLTVGYLVENENTHYTIIALVNTRHASNGIVIPIGCVHQIRHLTT